MAPEDVKAIVGDLPWMQLGQAQFARNLIVDRSLRRCLEIGHLHGVSTCYLAAAAGEIGGSLVSIDLPYAAVNMPNAEELLGSCGLTNVELLRDPGGAEAAIRRWLLPRGFDFAYIDGNHTWNGCGFQFFLVDRLLSPGGVVIFDDLQHADYPEVADVWRLLVKTHPGYTTCEAGNWGIATKNDTD